MVNHIVFLEDDRHLYNILKVAFQSVKPSLKLVQFAEGEHLLRYVTQPPQPVDVILLDIRVPGKLNGLQVAQALHKASYPAVVILTSAYAVPDNRLLTQLNCTFIPKPWNLPQLIRQLLNIEVSVPLKTAAPRRLTGALTLEQTDLSSPPAPPEDKNTLQLRQIITLARQALQVEDIAFLVVETSKRRVHHCVASSAEWEAPQQREYLLELIEETIKQERAVFHADIKLRLRNGTPLLKKVVSLAAVRVPLHEGYEGFVCVIGRQPRDWSEGDHDNLQNVAKVLAGAVLTEREVASLTERNNELNSYSSTIAHDLKAPLAAIIAYADVIKMLMIDDIPSEAAQYLTGIVDSSTAMSDMITRLLWLARLEHPSLSVGVVPIMPVINAALMRLQYHLRRHDVTVRLQADYPSVMGHDVWIEEVFANLISNAIKYAGDDNRAPTIQIRAQVQGSKVRFEVQDNGIGISKEDQARLFASFSRLHKVNTEGLGLGLVIILRIITQLGGEVGIESEVGVGSTFWFTLPVSP